MEELNPLYLTLGLIGGFIVAICILHYESYKENKRYKRDKKE